MPLPQKYEKLAHLPANAVGRDFVVGDLHGCYTALIEFMTYIKFDLDKDRMFSVGDLVDRGSENRQCAELIYEPWFYAVRGNHEDMMIRTLVEGHPGFRQTWLGNGGQWYLSEDKTELTDIAQDLNALPLMIAVGEGATRFNIVHAELIHRGDDGGRVPVTDQMIDDWVFDAQAEDDMIWGRTIISNGHPTFPPPAHQMWHDMDKMSMTFVGHTPVRDAVKCQRQMYIDGGAVFHYRGAGTSENNTLMIACPTEQVLYRCVLMNNTVIAISFDDIQQLA